jgi:hypothetical protein
MPSFVFVRIETHLLKACRPPLSMILKIADVFFAMRDSVIKNWKWSDARSPADASGVLDVVR